MWSAPACWCPGAYCGWECNGIVGLLLNLALTGYLIVLPLACAIFPSLGLRLRHWGLPIPGLAVTAAALIAHRIEFAAFHLADLRGLAPVELRSREALECALQICLFAIAVDATRERGQPNGVATGRGPPALDR